MLFPSEKQRGLHLHVIHRIRTLLLLEQPLRLQEEKLAS